MASAVAFSVNTPCHYTHVSYIQYSSTYMYVYIYKYVSYIYVWTQIHVRTAEPQLSLQALQSRRLTGSFVGLNDGGSAYVESWLKEAQRSAGPRTPPPPSPLSMPNSGDLRPAPPSPEPPDPLQPSHTAGNLGKASRRHEHIHPQRVYSAIPPAVTLIINI